MAGENIQLAQNTATDAGIPPADPALDAMPGDTGDLDTTDLTGAEIGRASCRERVFRTV